MILNNKLSNLIAMTLVVLLLFGCNVAKTDEEGNEISEKDLIAICDVGAYGMSLSSNYNLRPKPVELLIRGTKIKVIEQAIRDIEQNSTQKAENVTEKGDDDVIDAEFSSEE